MSYLRSYATRDSAWGAGDGGRVSSGAGGSQYYSAAGSRGSRRSDLLTGEDLGPPLMDPGEVFPPAPPDPSVQGCMSSLQMTTLIAKIDSLQAENMRLRDQLVRSRDKMVRDSEQVRVETNMAVEAARERAGERCEAAMSRLRLQVEALRKQNSQLSAQLSTHASKNRELVTQLQEQRIEASRKLREERERLRVEADDRERAFFGNLKAERDNLFEENEVLKREICSATGESREALEEDLRRSLFSDGGWSLECLARVRKTREAGGSGRSGGSGGTSRSARSAAQDGLAPVDPVRRSPPPSPRAEARKALELLKGNLSALISSVSVLDEQRLSLEQGLSALREAGSSMDKAEGASMTSEVFKEALRQAEKYRTELEEANTAQLDAKAQLDRVSRELDRVRRQSEEMRAELDSRARLGAEHDALVEENMQLVSAKSELEQRLSEAEAKVSNLTLELMEATEQLEEERARRSGFEPFSVQKSVASDEVQALNRKLEDATQQLRRAQRDLAQSRAETSRLQAETNQLRGRLALWGKWN